MKIVSVKCVLFVLVLVFSLVAAQKGPFRSDRAENRDMKPGPAGGPDMADMAPLKVSHGSDGVRCMPYDWHALLVSLSTQR